MRPDFTVTAAGIDITRKIADRLLALTITDEVGIRSDALEIVLDDRDGLIELPRPGAPLRVAMGYKETVTLPMGLYSCDEVSVKGPPDTMTIRCKAADMGGALKDQKTRAWDDITIGAIVETIAAEHDLVPRVAAAFKDVLHDHLDQTDESDLNFLTRIGADHGAIVAVKGGALLFIGQAEGKSTSGLTMPPRPLCKSARTSWSATLATRENFNTVEAFWHDRKAGARKTVTAGEGAPVKRLRHCCKDEADARRAAKAKLDECQRGNDTFSVTLPGDPLLAAGGQIIAIGFRPGLDGLWSVKTTTHSITSRGYTTKISCEKARETSE